MSNISMKYLHGYNNQLSLCSREHFQVDSFIFNEGNNILEFTSCYITVLYDLPSFMLVFSPSGNVINILQWRNQDCKCWINIFFVKQNVTLNKVKNLQVIKIMLFFNPDWIIS